MKNIFEFFFKYCMSLKNIKVVEQLKSKVARIWVLNEVLSDS